jgi:DNA-directed RNA polymerase I, II, and III subunit RPABC2
MFEEEKDDIESVVEEKKDDLETESESETVKDSDDEEEDDDYNEDDEENDEMSDNELPVAQKQPSAFLEPDDDEEDDDDNDDDYLQKFDDSIKQKIIEDYHPELKTHNYDEIEALSRVVRDNNGTIIDPLHKTLPFITKYEKARVLGERATQLNSGAKPFIEVDADIIDGYVIALKEFEQKKIPFIIKRPLPSGGIEYWKLEDLEFI